MAYKLKYYKTRNALLESQLEQARKENESLRAEKTKITSSLFNANVRISMGKRLISSIMDKPKVKSLRKQMELNPAFADRVNAFMQDR